MYAPDDPRLREVHYPHSVAMQMAADAVKAEREACAQIAANHDAARDCDERGIMDPETGEVPCSAETRGDVCLCAELIEQGSSIAKRIRARSTV